MAAFFYYASFPNSRNKNRAPTSAAVTFQVPIGILGDPLVRVAESNPNRTYILLENFSDTAEYYYLYALTANVNPTVTATFGVEHSLIWNPVSNILYEKTDSGLNTNWVVVLPQDVGEKILQFQTASLESLEDIYVLANTAVPGLYEVGVDEGRG